MTGFGKLGLALAKAFARGSGLSTVVDDA